MTSPRITFTYSTGGVGADTWWVRLEQEDLPDDTATLNDAADLLDTLYNLDACADSTETSEDDNESLGIADAPEINSTDLEETVDITVDRMACRFDADGNVDVTLRVIRSRQDAAYRLVLSGGTLLTTETVTEPYSQIILIENASSLTLDYPVVSGFVGDWSGAVYGDSAETPAINLNGNTLSFGGATIESGSVAVSYLTTYDRCTVTINGIDGEAGACTARVFFHGLVDELELEIPETSEPLASCTARWRVAPFDYDIECYQMVTVSTRCQCSDHEVATRTYDETVDCPESVVRCQGVETECRHLVGSVTVPEYVECDADNEVTGRPGMIYSLSTQKYYEEHCCKTPSFPLPDCPEKKISHKGGIPLSGGAAQYYNIYGPKLRITPVSPAGGICGDWTIRQEVRSSNCCDGVDPLVWDSSVSPEIMAPNSSAVVGVQGGGVYPYEWTVDGYGFQFSNGSTRTVTSGNQVRLAALPTACGTARVTVTDGCSAVWFDIRCTSGRWVSRSNFNPTMEAIALNPDLFICDSYDTDRYPGATTVLQGRWWVGDGFDPPVVRPMRYIHESYAYGLYASFTKSGYIMVPAPGTRGEVQQFPALYSPGIVGGTCVDSSGHGVSGTNPFWFVLVGNVYEWEC